MKLKTNVPTLSEHTLVERWLPAKGPSLPRAQPRRVRGSRQEGGSLARFSDEEQRGS